MPGNYHYTSNTVSTPKHCRKCEATTQHRVGGDHKARGCLVCLYKLDPRILSADELSVLGVTRTQLKLDIWAKQQQIEKRQRLEEEAPKQEALFA